MHFFFTRETAADGESTSVYRKRWEEWRFSRVGFPRLFVSTFSNCVSWKNTGSSEKLGSTCNPIPLRQRETWSYALNVCYTFPYWKQTGAIVWICGMAQIRHRVPPHTSAKPTDIDYVNNAPLFISHRMNALGCSTWMHRPPTNSAQPNCNRSANVKHRKLDKIDNTQYVLTYRFLLIILADKTHWPLGVNSDAAAALKSKSNKVKKFLWKLSAEEESK